MSEDPTGVQKRATSFAGPSPSGMPEQRQPVTKNVNPNVFHEEGPESNRHLTPEAAGITVDTTSRPGQTSDRQEIGGDQFSIGPESERRTLEQRDRRSEKRVEK